MEETKSGVPLGHVKHAKIIITEPAKMDFDMDYNNIMILIGQNGSGKTLILKFTWMINTLATHILAARGFKLPMDAQMDMQFILDNTLEDHKMDGELEFVFGSAKEGTHQFISIKFDKGTVTGVDYHFDEETECPAMPVYMSTTTRLLVEHVRYLKMKKMLGVPKGMPASEVDMLKLLEHYRLYDVTLLEAYFHRIENLTTPAVIKNFNERILNFDDQWKPVTNVRIDFEKPDIIFEYEGSESSATRLGAGHQALVSMILYQCY